MPMPIVQVTEGCTDMDRARDIEMRIDIDIDVHMDINMDTKNELLIFQGQAIFSKNSDYWISVKILIEYLT
jgi:hypothetical protein